MGDAQTNDKTRTYMGTKVVAGTLSYKIESENEEDLDYINPTWDVTFDGQPEGIKFVKEEWWDSCGDRDVTGNYETVDAVGGVKRYTQTITLVIAATIGYEIEAVDEEEALELVCEAAWDLTYDNQPEGVEFVGEEWWDASGDVDLLGEVVVARN